MQASNWYAVAAAVVTFAGVSMIDGWADGTASPTAVGAWLRIAISIVLVGALLLFSRKVSNPRSQKVAFGAAIGFAAYGLAQVHYTPIFSILAQS